MPSRRRCEPFAETKEHIGGFYIIEAPNLDAALAWASKVTNAIDTPIEVWPFMDIPNSAHPNRTERDA